MTKTEARKAVTKAVCQMAESLGYIIDDSEGYGDLYFIKEGDTTFDNSIQYRRSHFDTYIYNWSSSRSKIDADRIREVAQSKAKELNLI